MNYVAFDIGRLNASHGCSGYLALSDQLTGISWIQRESGTADSSKNRWETRPVLFSGAFY